MNRKSQDFYLRYILDALTRIDEYTGSGRAEFGESTLVQDAVIRNLEVVGEAVKSLDDRTTTQAPEIRWRDIAGMRDKLIHQYFGVDLDVVWAVVEHEIPRLRSVVERLIED